MSDTKRTDAFFACEPDVINKRKLVDVEFARQLERELNAALQELTKTKKELELLHKAIFC